MLYRAVCALAVIATVGAAPVGTETTLTPSEINKEAKYEAHCEKFMTSNGYSADEAKAKCTEDAGVWIQKKACITAMRSEGGHTTAEIKAECKDEADSERAAQKLQCRKDQRAKGVTDRETIKAVCNAGNGPAMSAAPATSKAKDPVASPVAVAAATELDVKVTPGEEKKEEHYEAHCEKFMTSNGYSADEAKAKCTEDAGVWIQKKACISAMRSEGGHTTTEIKTECKDEADSERAAQKLQCRKDQRAKGVTDPEQIRAACSGETIKAVAQAARLTCRKEQRAKGVTDPDQIGAACSGGKAPAASPAPAL